MTWRACSVAAAASLGLSAVVLLSQAGCSSRTSAQPGMAADTGGAVRVSTVPVTRGPLQRVTEATPAELLPYERTDLVAKISGFVKEIRVDYGDRVKKGELLVLLSVPELEVELQQKEALVGQAETELRLAKDTVPAAEAEYRFRESESKRLEGVARRGAIEQESALEARYAFEASKAKLEMARTDVTVKDARLRVSRANRDHVKTLLQYTEIEAPYDGVVTKRNLHTGAYIDPLTSTNQPLLTVVRTDLLRVVVDVPEKDVRYLDKDDTVVVDLDALPGQKFTWKITRFAPVLGGGKKVRVEVEVPNSDGTLYPGMYGHAAVILEDKPQALTLPAACVQRDDKGAFVWVIAEGKARQQRVTIGLNDGKRAEITAGLDGSEEVIGGGANVLQPGQAVQPVKTVAGKP